MLLFALPAVHCLTELLNEATPCVAFVQSESNTVHFIQTKVNMVDLHTLDKYDQKGAKTLLHIYRKDAGNQPITVYQDEKYARDNTFFFTAPVQGTYFVEINVQHAYDGFVGVEHNIYSGEANRPNIVSSGDVEVSKAEGIIKNLLEYVKNNISLQNMDLTDDSAYKKVYASIVSKAFLLVFLKIVATVFTLVYSSWKTKQFYTSQGLVNRK